MFTITVTEDDPEISSALIERYKQTVEVLDLLALIQTVNQKPRAPRADKGVKRKTEAV